MNGARFVHDEMVAHGLKVLVTAAKKAEGLAPPAWKTELNVTYEFSYRLA